MEPATAAAAIISACGGGAILFAVVNAVIKGVTGRAHQERERNTDLLTRERDANRRANVADEKRRLALDEIARLRGVLIERRISPGPELDLDRTLTPEQLRRLRKHP